MTAINHKRIRKVYSDAEALARKQLSEGTHSPGISVVTRAKGNAKLRKTLELYEAKTGERAIIGSWNLVPIKSCPGAKECLSYCYAMQGRFGMASVMAPRFRNLLSIGDTITTMETIRNAIVSWVTANGKRAETAILRFHDSGDFKDQEYVDGVAQGIKEARKLLKMLGIKIKLITYAYTKSSHLDLTPLASVGMGIVQSIGGKFDRKINPDLPVARVFSLSETVSSPWIDGQSEERADLLAIEGYSHIALSYHGSAKEPDQLRKRSDLVQIGDRIAA